MGNESSGQSKQEAVKDSETSQIISDDINQLFAGKQVIIFHEGVSQYRPNSPAIGQSACGLAALNCARLSFSKEQEGLAEEDLVRWLSSRSSAEEITAICDFWSNPSHLDMEDILRVRFFSNSISLVETLYKRCDLAGFMTLLQNMQKASSSSSAVMITKPPEIVACVKIPTSGGDVFLVFDSHIRSNHSGAGFIFSHSLEDTANYLSRLFWVDQASPLADDPFAWQMDLLRQCCGHIIVPKPCSLYTEADVNQSMLEDSMYILALTTEKASLAAELHEAKQEKLLLAVELRKANQEISDLQMYHFSQSEESSRSWATVSKYQRSSNREPRKHNGAKSMVASGGGVGVQQRDDAKFARELQEQEWGGNGDRYRRGSKSAKHLVPTDFNAREQQNIDKTHALQSHRDREGQIKSQDATGLSSTEHQVRATELPTPITCALCSEEVQEVDVARVPKCLHPLHKRCIKDYTIASLHQNHFPIPCPVCAAGNGLSEAGNVDNAFLKQIGVTGKYYDLFQKSELAVTPIHCFRCKKVNYLDRRDAQETKVLACITANCPSTWCKVQLSSVMASDDTRLEQLITQCKSNDVDVKVDALTKLQAIFEVGLEINDPDSLLNVLKTCLRTPNQHLTTATLASLPPLLPLLISRSAGYPQPSSSQARSPSSSTSSISPSIVVDATTLRQVLNAFLPAGGVIERLGDREKAQLKARETLVVLGGLAFRTGSGSAMSLKSKDKGPETPLAMFERFLREGGLGSKIWKVREQSILTLVHIRRAHHQFPIRPYLSLLVDCLEDTDAHVRDCARQSVVELFTGPGVTDGARADLKKEMTKKGVRKTIVDGVLSKLLGGSVNSISREGSENGDPPNTKPKDYIPPSLALQGRRPAAGSQTGGPSRAVSYGSVKDVSRPSSRAAISPPFPGPQVPPTPTNETSDIQPVYGKETEHNWAAREQAILRVRGMLKGDVHLRYLDAFLLSLKEGFIQWSLKTLASLRTTVSANTSSLYVELAVALGTSLDPFCETLFTNLLKMAGFTKKIAAQQSQASVTAIITHTSGQPRVILPLLWSTLQEKTVQARAFVVAHLKQYVEVHGHRSKNAIEGTNGLELLEKSLKKALGDANPAVRENARILFWVFEEVWPERGLAILESLDSIARKQVEKVCPRPELVSTLPPTTPKPKKSLAATIAASRAKAKAIATAPPTLRHQATSGSHAPPIRRPASPGTSPRSPTARPSSPLRMSSSPPAQTTSGRLRTTSGTMSRSVSSTSAPSITRSRSPSSGSNGSGGAGSPPSPTDYRRRASSPLATSATSINRPSTIRKALNTALPASPSSSGHVSPSARSANGVIRTAAVPIPKGHSRLSLQMMNDDDESLLRAQDVPIPDSDSDGDHSINLMSFSAPFEAYPPITPQTRTIGNDSASPRSVGSKPTVVSNALSSGSVADMDTDRPVVEDALRARAEQAESAAERLLELVDPEEEGLQHSSIPPSLLIGSNGHASGKTKAKPTPLPIKQNSTRPPMTPVNRNAAILRQAAMFQDSPVRNGQSSGSSLMDVLQGKKHETGWWLKRKARTFCCGDYRIQTNVPKVVSQGMLLPETESTDKVGELQGYIIELASGKIDIHGLQKLALFSIENSASNSDSPPLSPGIDGLNSPSPFYTSRSLPSLHTNLWEVNKTFERLFNALIQFLDPAKPEEELEYGLILLWELLENQGQYLEGRESDLFSVLLRVRYCNKLNVLEATSTLRDALTSSIEPVYGITTMHASLRAFHAETKPSSSDEDIKSAAYAFGLIALGKFILRLPAEIAEEELPRLRGTLISSLNDKTSLIVRESAAAAIIAAQLVLRDETHLFALLDGLADDKKNLLTYLFDKHGARGLTAATSSSGMDKLQKEISRLDTRTSTPLKPVPSATPIAVTGTIDAPF
ncbi:hypothetical protein DXG01_007900 [Tephrocybe rancida]|nr:hypothetical protein DXG01_007900 [Tephrocybe rancida]